MDPTKAIIGGCSVFAVLGIGAVFLMERPAATPIAPSPAVTIPAPVPVAVSEPVAPPEDPTPEPEPQPKPTPNEPEKPPAPEPSPPPPKKSPRELFVDEIREKWRKPAVPFVRSELALSILKMRSMPTPDGKGVFIAFPNPTKDEFPIAFARKVNGEPVGDLESAIELFRRVGIGRDVTIDGDELVAWSTASPKWSETTRTVQSDSSVISKFEGMVERREDKIDRYKRVGVPINTENYDYPISFYVHTGKDDVPHLMMNVEYWADEWLFFNEIVFACGDERIPFRFHREDIQRDTRRSGGIQERVAVDVSDNLDLHRLCSDQANEIVVRFRGQATHRDFTLSPLMKRDLQCVLFIHYADIYGK